MKCEARSQSLEKSSLLAFTVRSVIVFALFYSILPNLFAQPLSADTLAMMRCANIVIMPPSAMEFDIILRNTSLKSSSTLTSWERWANATCYLNVRNASLRDARCELDSTSLPRFLSVQNAARKGYETKIATQLSPNLAIDGGRIAIAFLGADSLQESISIPQGTERLLGRFRVEFADSLPAPEQVRLEWTQPLERFQANAFKVATERLRFQGIELLQHDNCEMITSYSMEIPVVEPSPRVSVGVFSADYAGDKKVRLSWRTAAESIGRRTNAGFALLRRVISSPFDTSLTVSRFDTIAHFRTISTLRLKGNGNGSVYQFLDSVRFRGDVMQYRLLALDATPNRFSNLQPPVLQATIARDTASVRIPNAVIESSSVEPNPFFSETRIRYALADRARVTVTLYDATGRMITRFMENEEKARGLHTFSPDVNSLALQGALFITITASPTDDVAVEKSEVVLKLQRVK